MNIKILTRTLGLLVMCGLLLGTAAAQEASLYSASADAALVSKYIWRGQRLTNDWSLQPAVTLGVGGLALNAWGNMDLTAVNDFNPGDPRSGSGDGLKGKFTEIDYTVSYDYSFDTVSVGAGTIFYTFPERFASTTEIYGSISLDTLPLAPSATIYIDVDETSASGDTGAYFLFGAGHSIALNHDIFLLRSRRSRCSRRKHHRKPSDQHQRQLVRRCVGDLQRSDGKREARRAVPRSARTCEADRCDIRRYGLGRIQPQPEFLISRVRGSLASPSPH
jgi:hypothetical protein